MDQDHKKQVLPTALAAAGLVVALHLIFMLFSGQSFSASNAYNSFSRQAAAWLEGRLDLGQDYPWLELAIYQGNYYVSFPPFPSYVLLPFVLLFGPDTPDLALALAVTGLGTLCASLMVQKLGGDSLLGLVLPVFLYGGTAVWQLTLDGSVWFFAQNLAFALTLASLLSGAEGKKGLSLFLLTAAVGCRPFNLFVLPVLLFLLWQHQEPGPWRKRLSGLLFGRFWVYLPAAGLALSYLVLNYARFQDPFEFGHNYLPEFVRANEGQFSLSYLAANLPSLYRLPHLDPATRRLVFPRFDGMNILLSYPILIWYLWVLGLRLWACRCCRTARRRLLAFHGTVLLLCALQTAAFLMHRTMGGHHYGNRYVGDVLPLVFFALCSLSFHRSDKARSLEQSVLSRFLFLLLLLAGLLFSFLGVLQTL